MYADDNPVCELFTPHVENLKNMGYKCSIRNFSSNFMSFCYFGTKIYRFTAGIASDLFLKPFAVVKPLMKTIQR